MSDDEEYYDDEFDEIWVEDVDPGIADDLAESTNYDATWFENPSLEVQEFFSDWDEQSDDYFDDDPTVVRRQRVMGTGSELATHHVKTPNGRAAGKKTQRQNGHGGAVRELSGLKPDAASFQGVVWKSPAHDTDLVKLHEPGNGEQVALLKNWREVFKNSHPSINRSRRRQKASDYLRSAVEPFDHAQLDSVREGDADMGDTPTTIPDRTPTPPPVLTSRTVQPPADPSAQPKLVDDVESYENPSETVTASSSEPQSTSQQSSCSNDTDTKDSSTSSLPSVSVSPPKRGKRKASVSVDEGADDRKITPEDGTRTRSKRIASKKLGDQPPTGAVRRSTRQRTGRQ